MDVFQPRSDQPIKNGASQINFGGKSMIGFDNSKDADPALNDINLYEDKFDDINYYKNYNLSGISPTPTRTVTPTPTTSITLTPSITSSIGLTQTPSITVTSTPSATLTSTPTSTSIIGSSTTPTPTPTVTPTTETALLPPVAAAYNSNKSAISFDNGDSWTTNQLPISSAWTSLAKGYVSAENDNFYILCSYNDIVLQSNDGINWSLINMNDFDITQYQWTSVCFADATNLSEQYFVMVGHSMSIAVKSIDGGSSWSSFNLPVLTYSNHISYGNNTFVVLSSGSTYLTSNDLQTWTQRSLPISSSDLINKLKFVNNKFIIVLSNSTKILSSDDGIVWQEHNSLPFSYWIDIDHNGTRYVMLSLTSQSIYYTTDLNTWSSVYLPFYNRKAMTVYDNVFIITNEGTIIYKSNNAITWTQRTIDQGNWTIIV